jgi:malonate transporter
MKLGDAFIPIWALAAVGYLARRRGLLPADAAVVLGRFVFYLAMPAALFLTMAATPLDRFDYRSLAAFAVGTVAVLGAGWYGASRYFDRKPGERPIWGMAAGYVNSSNLGIPVAQQVLGSVSFLAVVVLFQVLLVTPVILVALDRHGSPSGRIRLRRIASLPVRNPVILGSGLGVLWSAEGWGLPKQVGGSLQLLAAAAVPVALIAIGAALRTRDASAASDTPDTSDRPVAAISPAAEADGLATTVEATEARSPRAEIATITVLKLVAQPVVALGVGLLLRLSPDQLRAVVVCSGLPTAQNTFIFAQEYGVGAALANRAVVATTALSLGTLALAATLLR